MKEKITIDKAINRGQLMVNLPVFVTTLSIFGLGFYLESYKFIPEKSLKFFIFAGIIIPWLIWSFRITKWRIWAYDKVLNINELKDSAVKNMLIWPEGHFFEKTEIRTKKDKLMLKKLENQFINNDK